MVQWGARGVVLSRQPEKSYGTAFFEAFPKGGGFVRGEGKTIVEAEHAALAQFRRESVCTHRWGRGYYTNGGAVCRNCGAFQTVFKPIVKLGAWRDPLCAIQLISAMMGDLRPCNDDRERNPYRRRQELRLRRVGIKLPSSGSEQEEDAYIHACRVAVLSWYRDQASAHAMPRSADSRETAITAMFDAFSKRMLDAALRDAQDEGMFDAHQAGSEPQ